MKRAFTLIELLIVVAIVAILATVLFPVFAAAKEPPAQQCLKNLNNIGRAVKMYAADYDDYVVPWLQCKNTLPGCHGGPSSNGLRIWNNKLVLYMHDEKIRRVDTQDGYYPPSGPFLDPEWNEPRLIKSGDQADCDGPGFILSLLNFTKGVDNRLMLFAEYGLAYPMCSPTEANTRPECDTNGGGIATPGDYGRDGSSRSTAFFAMAGSQLYPTGSPFALERRLSEIVRPGETALSTDGGTWRANSSFGQVFYDALGCEGTFIHLTTSNSLMADGHSVAIPGNPEEVRVIGTDGNWIERYFTFYE